MQFKTFERGCGKIIRYTLAWVGIALFSGCSLVKWDASSHLRRLDGSCSENVSNAYTCVLDYSECLEGECGQTNLECLQNSRVELKKEYFDPTIPFQNEYRLSKGDVLEVSVLGEKEVTIDNAVVAPDGYLYFTVIEGIYADGLTLEEVRKAIKEKLTHLFLNPIVTVAAKVVRGQSFKILGRVIEPGEYSLSSPTKLREALADSGGLLLNDVKDDEGRGFGNTRQILADLDASFIVRDNQKLDINFHSLLFEGDESQNIYVRPNDYIFIAPKPYEQVYLIGQVTLPRRLTFTKGLTLMGAISQSVGWNMGGPYSADITRVLVIRGSLEDPRVAQVDLKKILYGEARDILLQPGDIVYMQNKPFRFLREVVRVAIDTFLYSFATSAGNYYGGSHWFQTPESHGAD